MLVFENDDLGCKLPLGAVAGADADFLSWVQLTDPRAPQSFHVDEDIRGRWIPADKAVAFAAVEPFHGGIKCRPIGLCRVARRLRHFHRLLRCAVVEFDYTQGLESLGASDRFAGNTCPYVGDFESRLSNTGLVQ